MAGLIALWLVGCALHGEGSGVVRVVQSGPQIDSVSGQSWSMKLSGNSKWIEHLEGDSVWVAGRRLGDTIWVKEWRVITGADGSAPYLGLLRRHGANLVLQDWNSGGEYVFDDSSYERMGVAAGKVVLVRGFVVGPHTLHVVDWRPLEQATP